MKVFLLNPPTLDDKKYIREGRCTQEQGIWTTLWPPVTLATLAAVLLEEGHDVAVLDCPAENLDLERLRERVLSFSPDVALWSTGTPSIKSDLQLAGFLKSWKPAAWTGVFGTHVTALDRECLSQTPQLDAILRNEPEYTARELLRILGSSGDLGSVLGLTYACGGEIHRNPERPFIENLDTLPMPAWHLVNPDSYRLPLKGERFLIVAPLRGCPFSCSFCTAPTFYGHKLRKRSVGKVVEEIRYDQERFGVHHFFFWADTFVLDKDYVRKLCGEILSRKIKIAWTSNSRVDTVDPELLKLMAKSGCWMLSFGIESADQKVLDLADKKIRVEQIRQAVRWTREAGIQVAGHFILGLPGETPESLEATIRFPRTLDVDFAQFYCAVPYPGAPLYQTAKREGWIQTEDFNLYKQEKYAMALNGLSPQQVMAARRRAHAKFYFRAKTLFRALRNIHLRHLGHLFATLKRFLSDHFQRGSVE